MADAVARRIVIASFITPNGAESTLDRLKGASIGMGNTAVVTRDESGDVQFTESQDWGMGKSALVGAIAGLLLPGVGTIALAAGGAMAAYFIDRGFPDAQLKQMGEGLAPDGSMLVLLVADVDVDRAISVIAECSGTVIGTTTESDLTAAVGNLQP